MRRRWALLAAIGVIALTGMSLRSGPLGRIIIRTPIVLLRAILWPDRSPAAPAPDVAGLAGSDEAAPPVPVPASAGSAPAFGRPDPAPAARLQQRTGLKRGQALGAAEGDITASGAAGRPHDVDLSSPGRLRRGSCTGSRDAADACFPSSRFRSGSACATGCPAST